MTYLLGKVGALEKEITRVGRELAWTQQEMDRAGKEMEEELKRVEERHQRELDQLRGATSGGKDERKGADPPPFGGNQRDLEGWITTCRLTFANQPSKFGTERKKVLWATTFLTGPPLQAFQPMVNRLLTEDVLPAELENFETFATALRSLYGDPNLEQNAKTALHYLKQEKSSVTAYYSKFVSHSQYANLPDGALADKFYRGLNEKIKDKLAEGGPWKGLFDLKTRAIQYDSRMRERQAERDHEAKAAAALANPRKPDAPQPPRLGFTAPPRNPPTSTSFRPSTALPPRPAPSPATPSSDGTTPMELDAQTRASLSNEECRRRGLCYECKERGHRFWNCPLRAQYSAVEVDLAENDSAQE